MQKIGKMGEWLTWKGLISLGVDIGYLSLWVMFPISALR
jgi:hypothetical protein